MSEDASNPAHDLPPLAVVVVNWNGRPLLADCLGSLREQDHPELRVVMVDNASADDSVDWCRAHHPEVEIVVSPENRRWAGGNNLGLEHLRRDGFRGLVLLLNNDTIVPAGALRELAAAMADHPESGAATPRICYADRPDLIWYDGGRVGRRTGWIRHEGIRRPAAGRSTTPRTVDYGTGCALLVDTAAIEAIGPLDEDFDLYAEDTDWCLRLRATGRTVLHVPSAVILHKVSMSSGADSPAKAYRKSRSHVRLLRRHWAAKSRLMLWPAQIAYLAAQSAWQLWRGHPETAVAVWRGAGDELAGRRVEI